MELASRLSLISEPQTIKMAKLSREMKGKGIDIVDLSLGEPDFITPKYICDAATQAMAEGYTKYPPVAGLPDLLDAISAKLLRQNNLHYSREEIIVSTGAKQSLANAVLSIVNPGDEVIIPTPYWVTYSAQVCLAEGVVRYIPCSIDTDYKLTPGMLEKAITDKTKLFMFSSPCNPSGSVYSHGELAALAEVFKKHPHIFIISDEIYEYINYGGSHQSIAQFPELRNRVIIINGFSKGYAMTGWRLGYMAAPKEIARACEKLQGQITSGANIVSQRAAIVALNGDQTPTKNMVAAFRERREYIIDALKNMPGIKVNNPEGAFYAFPNISAFFGKTDGTTHITNDEDLSMYLLNTAHITTVCGSAFGNDNCIRISFATSIDTLKKGMERMAKALANLK
ncbi:MAG: pyridoxal phosphate-dependent aminotransferase [Taibaiella sp.]|nr:pyridoxal phosphate-dependent aminotransferase [Taibaiella sp.]